MVVGALGLGACGWIACLAGQLGVLVPRGATGVAAP